jgi:sialidase-1
VAERAARAGSTVFRAGDDGYASYRIPAVIAVVDELLVFAEGRRDGAGDSGAIDLVLRRSSDGGRQWHPLQMVVAGGGETVGNPVPIGIPSTTEVMLLFTRNDGAVTEAGILAGRAPARQPWCIRSSDAGHRWSDPEALGPPARDPGWRWYATGPGHGIVLRHGPAAGRLLAPANHSRPPDRPGQPGTDPCLYGAHGLVSDDAGRTWRVGYRDDQSDARVNANETTLAKQPDGRVYVNARNQHGSAAGSRAHGWSVDGGASLAAPLQPVPPEQLPLPEVQASVLQPAGPATPLLISGPSDPHERRVMAVRASADAGATWQPLAHVTTDPAGYSDLVDLGWPTVGLAFETGASAAYERIDFVRLDLRA